MLMKPAFHNADSTGRGTDTVGKPQKTVGNADHRQRLGRRQQDKTAGKGKKTDDGTFSIAKFVKQKARDQCAEKADDTPGHQSQRIAATV